jgi:Fur family transcriptional regulator, ferric uptake regulator
MNNIEKIKKAGFKLTPRRKAMVELFEDCQAHLTPEEVWKKLKRSFSRCGLPSVYRNLESLVECGILTRIQQFDRTKHYGLCSAVHGDHHHHHLTCIRCGLVEDIKDCAVEGLKKIKGFRIVNHFMQVNGICPGCLKKTSSRS